MKKLKKKTGAKVAAILLLCVTVLVFIASVADMAYMDSMGAYRSSYEDCLRRMMKNEARDVAVQAADDYYVGMSVSTAADLRLTIADSEGNELYTNYNGEPTVVSYSFPYTRISDIPYYDGSWETQTEHYQITAYVLSDYDKGGEIGSALRLFNMAYSLRYTAIAAAVGSFLVGILLYVFLLSAAGVREGSEEIRTGFAERIPFDIFTVLIIAGISICVKIIDELFGNSIPVLVMSLLLLLAAGLLFLWWSMSLSVRIKTKTVWENSVCGWFFGLLRRGFCFAGRVVRELLHSVPLLPRGILIALAVLFVDLVLFMIALECETEVAVFLWFVERLILLGALAYLLWCAVKLRDGAKAVANGDMSVNIDGTKMLPEFRAHAEDINNIRSGIEKAVDERIRSERFRTELITNVSHDIKTPLTSIISYVDLLEKEGTENERQREYLDVLSRQSARLKKLIDDLMDASKASTGNLPVRPEKCELGVLLDQTAGEYGERLDAKGLELIIKKPAEAVTVMADRKHIWRIFDNLMNNILKYAQSGTRVYLTLEAENGFAAVSFRNISRARIEQDGEELTERFVRGDSSRSSEGSGLGLSIAKSLAELQNGSMHITVDGDLFKVILRFPMAQNG